MCHPCVDPCLTHVDPCLLGQFSSGLHSPRFSMLFSLWAPGLTASTASELPPNRPFIHGSCGPHSLRVRARSRSSCRWATKKGGVGQCRRCHSCRFTVQVFCCKQKKTSGQVDVSVSEIPFCGRWGTGLMSQGLLRVVHFPHF